MMAGLSEIGCRRSVSRVGGTGATSLSVRVSY
jgi:hypothetical protein